MLQRWPVAIALSDSCTHAHTRTLTCTHVHTQASSEARTHARTRTLTCTHVHTYASSHARARTHTNAHRLSGDRRSRRGSLASSPQRQSRSRHPTRRPIPTSRTRQTSAAPRRSGTFWRCRSSTLPTAMSSECCRSASSSGRIRHHHPPRRAATGIPCCMFGPMRLGRFGNCLPSVQPSSLVDVRPAAMRSETALRLVSGHARSVSADIVVKPIEDN